MLVKLTYTPKGDDFAIRTLLGDPSSIWDLWFLLKDLDVTNITLTDVSSCNQLDPTKGVTSMMGACLNTFIDFEPGYNNR